MLRDLRAAQKMRPLRDVAGTPGIPRGKRGKLGAKFTAERKQLLSVMPRAERGKTETLRIAPHHGRDLPADAAVQPMSAMLSIVTSHCKGRPQQSGRPVCGTVPFRIFCFYFMPLSPSS